MKSLLDFIKSSFAITMKPFIKISVLFVCLIWLPSCSNIKKAAPPELSQDQMVDALTSIYINEAKTLVAHDISVQKDEYFKDYLYPAIFDSLGILATDFDQSYAYYEDQTSEMIELMNLVIANIDSFSVDSMNSKHEESLENIYNEIHEIEEIKKLQERKRKRGNVE